MDILHVIQKMDGFLEYIKQLFFTDYEDDNVKAVTRDVDRYMNKLKMRLNKKLGFVHIKRLHLCGSMAERTRIMEWMRDHEALLRKRKDESYFARLRTAFREKIRKWFLLIDANDDELYPYIEYDYLAVFNLPNIFEPKESHSGFMNICQKPTKPETAYYIKTNQNVNLEFVSVQCIKYSFRKVLEDVIKDLYPNLFSRKNFFGGLLREYTSPYHCSNGSLRLMEYHRDELLFHWVTDTKIEFRTVLWENKMVSRQANKYIIKVDFLPVFEGEATGPMLGNYADSRDCFLIPKNCENISCGPGDHDPNRCWRISFCLTEVKALRETSQCHRDVYMFIKYFILLHTLQFDIKSYHVKQVILRHIKVCKRTAENTLKCFIETVEDLIKCMTEGKVPTQILANHHVEFPEDLLEARGIFGLYIQILKHKFDKNSDYKFNLDKNLSVKIPKSRVKKIDKLAQEIEKGGKFYKEYFEATYEAVRDETIYRFRYHKLWTVKGLLGAVFIKTLDLLSIVSSATNIR